MPGLGVVLRLLLHVEGSKASSVEPAEGVAEFLGFSQNHSDVVDNDGSKAA